MLIHPVHARTKLELTTLGILDTPKIGDFRPHFEVKRSKLCNCDNVKVPYSHLFLVFWSFSARNHQFWPLNIYMYKQVPFFEKKREISDFFTYLAKLTILRELHSFMVAKPCYFIFWNFTYFAKFPNIL